MYAAQDANATRTGWTATKVILAFLLAMLAGFVMLGVSSTPAHAKTGQPSDWTVSYGSGDGEVKWGITNPKITNVSNTESKISVDIWTASAKTFSRTKIGYELWLDGFIVGSGNFYSSNSGGWLVDSTNQNCTKNATVSTRSISKYSSKRECTLVLVIKYKNETYNYGYAPTVYLPAATRVNVANGSFSMTPSSPNVGSTMTVTYTYSQMPKEHLMLYWYRDGVEIKRGVYTDTSSRSYTVTGADRGHTITCIAEGDTSAYYNSKSISKTIPANITNKAITNGWYWINNSYGKYADVNGPGTGAYIKNYTQNWTAAQLFYIEGNSSSGYYIRTTHGTAWNVPGGTSGDYDNSPIHNWTYPDTSKWRIGGSVGSYGQIQSMVGSQRLLGVFDDSRANNAEFVLHSEAQATWRLNKANVNATAGIQGSGRVGSPIKFNLWSVGDLNLYNSGDGCYKVTYQVLRDGSQTNMPWGEMSKSNDFWGSYTPTAADVGHRISVRIAVRTTDGLLIDDVTTSSITVNDGKISNASIPNGWYVVKDAKSGKVLDLDNTYGPYAGANVHLWDDSRTGNMIWYVSGNASSGYTLRNASGYALDVADGVDADGTNVWGANWFNNTAQHWRIEATPGSAGRIQSMLPGGRMLDIDGQGTANGTNVHLWSDSASRWVLEKLDTSLDVIVSGETLVGEDVTGNITGAGWAPLGTGSADGFFTIKYEFLRDGNYAVKTGNCSTSGGYYQAKSTYTTQNSDLNHYIKVRYTITSVWGKQISQDVSSMSISILPQGTGIVTGGDKLYYTSSSVVSAESGITRDQIENTDRPIGEWDLCVVNFNNRNGSFRLKNVATDQDDGVTGMYDLVVTVNNQNKQYTGTLPNAGWQRTDSVYFAFSRPDIYPSNEEFHAAGEQNQAPQAVSMWMKTHYYRTNVTMKLVKAGTNTPVNFKMWGRCSDVDIMPGYTMWEDSTLGVVPPDSVYNAYYEGSEFLRMKSAGTIKVASNTLLMQDAANKGVYAPKRAENDGHGSPLYSALVQASSSNGTLQLEYGGTNCGINYNFEAMPSGTTTLKSPQMSITKTADGSTYETGDTVTYTMRIYNRNGDSTVAENVNITDAIPSGLSYIAGSLDAYNTNGTDGTKDPFTVGNPSATASGSNLTIKQSSLGGDDQIVVTFKARVTKTTSGSITNTAYASCDGGTRVSGSDTIRVIGTTQPKASLYVTKSVSPTTAEPGDRVTYSILVRNTSSITATNVKVTDSLPTGLTPVSTSRGSFSGNNLTYNHGSLASGSSFTITVTATVKSGTEGQSITNWAYATCGNGSGDNDYATFNVPSKPRVTVSKDADADSYTKGDTVNWTVVVRNNVSGTTAQNVKVTDLVPSGITVTSAKATSTGDTPTVSRSGNNVTVSQSSLAYNKTITINITGTAKQTGSFKNTATATISNGTGGEASDTIVVTEPAKAAISIVKESNGTSFSVGDEVDYRITVANNSGIDAQNVKVTDVIPSNLKPISCDIGTLSGNNWSYSATLMNTGTSFTATIKTTAVSEGTGIVNTAKATISNGTGGQDDATIDIAKPALEVVKTADAEQYFLNDTVTYTVTVKNTVPNSTAKNVNLTDVLPAELELVRASGTSSDGTANVTTDGNTIHATCTSLQYNDELRVVVTAKAIATGTVENTATATSDNGTPDEDNETVTVIERTPALEVSKVADAETYKLGDTITYTITVTNPVDESLARDVVVTDALPENVALVDVTAKATTGEPSVQKNGNAFTVKLGELAGGDTITITVTGTAEGIGEAVNTAKATGNDENGDPVDPAEDDEIVTITPGDTTLDVTKTADKEQYLVGEAVTYTIKVTNTGESPAMGVTFTDQLPVYLTAAEQNPAQLVDGEGTVLKTWSTLPEDGVFALDDDETLLEAGETWTLTVHAVAAEPGLAIENTVVVDSDNSEPDEDTEIVDLIAPKLSITKTANTERAQIGDVIEYTIVAKNVGTANIVNAQITDEMPANLDWTAPAVLKDAKGAVLGTWESEPADGVYAIAGGIELAPNESVTLVVKGTATAQGTATNIATVTGEDENGDPVDPAEDTEIVEVATPSVTITKTADAGYYQVGDTITWTVVVTNNAPNTTAKNVVVTDAIPTGIDGATSTVGAIEGGTFTWTIGELPYGVTKTAQISGTATEAAIGNVTNTAHVKHDDGEDNAEVTTPVVDPEKPTLVIDKQADKTDYQVGDEVKYTVVVKNASANTDRPLSGSVRIAVNDNGTEDAQLAVVVDGAPADAQLAYQWYHGENPIANATSSTLASSSSNCDSTGVHCIVYDASESYTGVLESGIATGSRVYGDLPTWRYTYNIVCPNRGNVTASHHEYSTAFGGSYDTKMQAYQAGLKAAAKVKDKCDYCGATCVGKNVEAIHRKGNTYTWDVDSSAGTPVAGEPSNVVKNVNVSDLVPENIQVSNATATSTNGSPTVTRDGNDVAVKQSELAPGETITITITGKAVAEGEGIVNTATATGEDPDGEPLDPAEDDATVNVNDANVTITKTADAASYQVGDTITWNITVENTEAGTTAHNVVVTDTIPDGIENVQTSAGSVADGVITWNVGDVAYGTPQTLTVTGVASKAAEGSVTNTATVTHDGGEDDDEVTVEVTDPGLTIAKTVDKQTVKIGDVVTYTINMKNTGSAPVYNATITDVMPDNMTWTAPAVLKDVRGATFATWNTEPTGSVYAVENGLTLEPGQEVVLTVKATAAADGTATNVAVGTGEDEGGNPVDPVEDDETVTVTTPNVQVTKRANAVQYQVGDTITYKISVANTTPGTTATNVVVTDEIPAGIADVAVSAGELDGMKLTWQVGSLTYGQSAEMTVTGTVTEDALGKLANTAIVKHDDGEDDDEEIVEVIEKTPWMLTKTADKESYHPGETITWNVTLTRGEAEEAPVAPEKAYATLYGNGTMIFTQGVPTTEQNATYGGAEDATVVGQWTGFEEETYAFRDWAPWALDASRTATKVVFAERVKPVSTAFWFYGFEAARSYEGLENLDMSSVTDASSMFAFNSALEDAALQGILATLDVGSVENFASFFERCDGVEHVSFPEGFDTSKGTNFSTFLANCNNLSSVNLSNLDTSNGTNMAAFFYSDNRLADITFGGKFDVSKNESFTQFFYGCKGLKRLDLSDGFDTSSGTQFEHFLDDCSQLETVDLGDAFDMSNSTSNLLFFGFVTDNPNDGLPYLREVTLPAGFSFNGCSLPEPHPTYIPGADGKWYDADGNGWTPDELKAAWTPEMAGTYYASKSLVGTLNLQAVVASLPLANLSHDVVALETAHARTAEQGSKPNDTAVKAEEASQEGAVALNEVETFESADAGVQGRAVYPSGPASDEFTMTDSTQKGGTTDVKLDGEDMGESESAWQSKAMGSLKPGESKTWTVTAVVTDDAPETITNTAVVTLDDGTELRAESTVNVVRDNEFEIEKTADKTAYKMGDTVTYTIDAVNNGPDTTINWKVFDEMPEGLEFESATVAYKSADNVVNTYDAEAEYYSFPAEDDPMDYVLEAGDHVYVTIKAKATIEGQISNTARFESLGGDPVEDTEIVTTEKPGVEITKTADAELYKVGDTITWTVSVTNTVEGTTATNVVVTDTIPAGVENVTASAGSVANGTFTWQIGDLPYGETKTATLTGTVTDEAGDTLTNKAVVTHDDGEDEDEVTVDVEHPIPTFDVDKTSDADVYGVGDTINYTIIVTNTSEYDAENVKVTDTMPSSLKPISTDTGSISGQVVTATIPHMAAGETVIINVSAEALAAGSVTNYVKVECEGSEPADDEVTVEVKAPALSVTKRANVASAIPGDAVTWTITVQNTVPGTTAHNVVVTDVIPDHFVNAKSDGATVNGNTFTWNVGDLKYGETATITITGNVADDYHGEIVNVAKATCDNGPGDEDDAKIDAQREFNITYIRDVSHALPDGEMVFAESAYEGDVYNVNPEATEAADREDCYRFDGWYLDPECTKPYVPTELTGDLTLYSKNYAKLNFEWTAVAEFPELTDPQYRIPADPPLGYEIDTSITSMIFTPYELPLYEQEDGSKANWTECAWGEEFTMPKITDPDRATWGGRDWIEWHAKGWFDNDQGTGSPFAEFGGTITVGGDDTYYADVIHSSYSGSIG